MDNIYKVALFIWFWSLQGKNYEKNNDVTLLQTDTNINNDALREINGTKTVLFDVR